MCRLHVEADITIEALPPGQWAAATGAITLSSRPMSVVVHVTGFGRDHGRADGRRVHVAGLGRVAPPPCRAIGMAVLRRRRYRRCTALVCTRPLLRLPRDASSHLIICRGRCCDLRMPRGHVLPDSACGGPRGCRRGLGAGSTTVAGDRGVRRRLGSASTLSINRAGTISVKLSGSPSFAIVYVSSWRTGCLAKSSRVCRPLVQGSQRRRDRRSDAVDSVRRHASTAWAPHILLEARNVFVEQPAGDFVRPLVAFLGNATPTSPGGTGAECGPGSAAVQPWNCGSFDVGRGRLRAPYSGLKVLDLGVYWAGPIITMYLASFGADVIKVESHKRPDPFRFSTSSPELGTDWWERSAVWQATNLGKRGTTLDLTHADGQRIARRFIAQADVLIENFTPRVLSQLGIDLDAALAENPRLIVLRLPGFGLDGPWRDHVAWAPTLEQASGLAHVTGFDSGPPLPPGGCADPLAGMHGLLALQAALEHRDRTGEGQIVEMSQLEALVSMTAEQVIAARCSGRNYPVASGTDTRRSHLTAFTHARARTSGLQSQHWMMNGDVLIVLMDRTELLSDSSLADPEHRQLRHDELDVAIKRLCRLTLGCGCRNRADSCWCHRGRRRERRRSV